MPALEYLQLGGNDEIGAKGCEALAPVLAMALEELRLGENQIDASCSVAPCWRR